MSIILFAYTDVSGLYQEVSYGHEDLESCLDLLTYLVSKGYMLYKVYLNEQSQQMPLPVEAFDGEFMGARIKQLQQQWELILA